MMRPPPRSPLFPYAPLSRSAMNRLILAGIVGLFASAGLASADGPKNPPISPEARARLDALIASYRALPAYSDQDRKSTRLNSSHSQISYAVFCLKKKNTHTE